MSRPSGRGRTLRPLALALSLVSLFVAPPSPPPAFAGSKAIIKRVNTAAPEVAITFDACATKSKGYGFDRPVYEVLQREQVPATIFVSGRWVESHPHVMQELAADPLIEFANHSYDHPHLTRLGAAAIGTEIDQTEEALAQYGKRSVAFRPPFGDFSSRVLDVVRGRQLPAVLWDVVSGDPSRAVSAEAMIRTVVRKTRAGSIVIFHINGRGMKTADALPVILDELRQRGFRFVHLSTLLAEGADSAPLQSMIELPPAAPAPAPTPARICETPPAPEENRHLPAGVFACPER